ncbi:MAG: HAD hydrolase family protein [Bacteroidetes bacterium]|nr:HAD hydrolase family protein [Bacteroidota bacterium]
MNVLEVFQKITTFIFDVDGVLTDGTVLVLENGLQARRMNVKDGVALQMALKKGYNVLVVSGGNSPQVVDRLNKLGVKNVFMSVNDKKTFIADYLKNNNISKEQTLYMADDLPDIAAMEMVGLPCCPADAVSDIKEVVKYISPFKGGDTCVRDVIEKVLRHNDHWKYEQGVTSR